MNSTKVTHSQMAAIWHAVASGDGERDLKSLRGTYSEIMRDGHAGSHQVDDILYASGCGTCSGKELYEAFAYPGHVLYPRPGVRVTAAVGWTYSTAAEVAALLKMLERLGIAVDPAPLVDAVLPSLKSKPYLTQAEMDVWWFHKERHRMETVMIETDRGAGSGKYHKFKTSTGYRVEASERGGRVEWMTIRAPRYRFRSKLMAA